MSDQQKADLIINYLRNNGPSTYREICEGTVPEMNYYQFERGRFFIHHVMQTVLGEPFCCNPTNWKYQLPQIWDDNLLALARHLKSLRTYAHLVASNLTAAHVKWAGTADEDEIEDLKISVTRLYEDFERTVRRVSKKHSHINTGIKLPTL